MSATLATNHADQLHEIAAIREKYADSLTDEQEAALQRIGDHLLQIDVARKYFKTVYVQKELAYLSRVLLYVCVPTVLASGFALLFYNTHVVGFVPDEVLLEVIVVAFTLGFAPLAILFPFVLRLAWVAQRTATVAPFATQQDYRP